MSGKSPQSTGSARAGAVRTTKTANPGRGVIFMDVLHGTWGSLGESKAFSSEVETGSRQENASNQESRAPFRFYRNGKGSRIWRFNLRPRVLRTRSLHANVAPGGHAVESSQFGNSV